MFTGIVQAKGTIVSCDEQENLKKLVVSVPEPCLDHLTIGASIAINGVCLTVTRFEVSDSDVVGQVYFDIIDETLKVTNLGQVKQKDSVNFERSLTFGMEIGGHIVSGHIQTTAQIDNIIRSEENCEMQLKLDSKWMQFILHKGFIAIDGISLTVGEVREDGFSIHLIPETLAKTNLGSRQLNDVVNIEVDQQTYTIVKTVERVLGKSTLDDGSTIEV